MNLEQAIFDLWLWQTNPNADHFTVQLYRLIAKADPYRKAQIALGFPTESLAFELWYTSEDPDMFFNTHLEHLRNEKRNKSTNDNLGKSHLKIVRKEKGYGSKDVA